MKNVIYEVQISIVGQMEECTQYKNKLLSWKIDPNKTESTDIELDSECGRTQILMYTCVHIIEQNEGAGGKIPRTRIK